MVSLFLFTAHVLSSVGKSTKRFSKINVGSRPCCCHGDSVSMSLHVDHLAAGLSFTSKTNSSLIKVFNCTFGPPAAAHRSRRRR